MKFKHKWKIETEKEMEMLFMENDKNLHNLIVDEVLLHYRNRKKTIPILSIHTKDSKMNFDICVDPQDIPETLMQNLKIMENYEDYERCTKIQNIITIFKNKG